jgi:ATP-dependent RNA helicase UAP56/SUB2
MAPHDEEELVDYDEGAEENFTAPAAEGVKSDVDKKGSYVGIHSTGFRLVDASKGVLASLADHVHVSETSC